MPNYNQSAQQAIADVHFGMRVDKAAVSVAGANTKSIFTVAGGNCLILGLIGESTTGQAAGANAAKYISTPTVGTAVDLCVAGDIVSQELGGFFSITGVLGATAIAGANAGAAVMMTTPIMVPPGVIGFATAGNTAGSYKFSIWYVPAEEGGYISAA